MAIQELIGKIRPRWHADGVESIDEIESAEKALGIVLPADYKYIMMELGAGEADLPGGYLRLYPIRELPARQESGLPVFAIFGSDGGDHSFGFDMGSHKETASYKIVEFPTSTLDPDEVEIAADSLEAFLWQRLQNL